MHRVIRFRQEAWLKPYIGMITEIRKNMVLKKDFFKLKNNVDFSKNMENVGKHWAIIKLATTN